LFARGADKEDLAAAEGPCNGTSGAKRIAKAVTVIADTCLSCNNRREPAIGLRKEAWTN
jgi:hypothetical protein